MTGKGFLFSPDFSSFPWPEQTLKILPEDFNPYCDPDHEDSNKKLPQNTLARDDAPQYHAWLQKAQQFR